MSGNFLTPEKYLSPQEVSRFRRSLQVEQEYGFAHKSKTPIRDAAVLSTILGAGLRVSEATHLKVGNLFLEQDKSELLIERSKFGKSRIVQIGKDVRRNLRNYLKWKSQNGESLEDNSHLFISRKKTPYTTRAIQLRFQVYKEKAGIKKNCGIHALRHTFALLLYRASGYNLRLVQKQLGHASILTTQVYADVLDCDTELAVEKMFDIVDMVEV